VILKIDRIAIELPMPDDPDPNGAAAVQELLGGRFGEKSTFMSYKNAAHDRGVAGRQDSAPQAPLSASV
jgi:Mn-containing catalase